MKIFLLLYTPAAQPGPQAEGGGEEEGERGRQEPGGSAAAGERHVVAVAQDHDTGPGFRRGAGSEAVLLGGPERGGHALALCEMAVEAVEERGAVVVAQGPEARHDRVGSGLEEGAREPHHPFAAQDLARGAAARGEHHDPAVEVEPGDLAHLEEAVLLAIPGGEHDARTLG